ncbi:MAG: hypothetical protein H6Q90_847 [Deltaproteobacteria bacterium]|nr:hypothetical protein [Deltaproteobacteria bacterium]
MRVVSIIIVLALATSAGAEPPGAIALAVARTDLLGGHLSVRLATGMVGEADRAQLDWGSSRLVMEARELSNVPSGTLHEQVTAALGDVPGTRIESIQVPRPWTAFAVVPRFPRRVGARSLVLAAYVANHDAVELLTFYVNDAAFDDAASWVALGRRIVATMIPATPLGPRATRDVTSSAAPALPRGWQLTGDAGTYRLGARRGERHCDIHEDELDAQVVADPVNAKIVGGRLRNHDVYWTVWTDRGGVHAESMIGASHWGTFHVVCHARTRTELDALRHVLEARYAESPR